MSGGSAYRLRGREEPGGGRGAQLSLGYCISVHSIYADRRTSGCRPAGRKSLPPRRLPPKP